MDTPEGRFPFKKKHPSIHSPIPPALPPHSLPIHLSIPHPPNPAFPSHPFYFTGLWVHSMTNSEHKSLAEGACSCTLSNAVCSRVFCSRDVWDPKQPEKLKYNFITFYFLFCSSKDLEQGQFFCLGLRRLVQKMELLRFLNGNAHLFPSELFPAPVAPSSRILGLGGRLGSKQHSEPALREMFSLSCKWRLQHVVNKPKHISFQEAFQICITLWPLSLTHY